MKLEFFEGDFGTQISLIPEDMDEVKKLLKVTTNTKRIPAEIRFDFSGQKDPEMRIWLPKVKVQKNSIYYKQ